MRPLIRVLLVVFIVIGAFVWGQNRGINLGVEESMKLFPTCSPIRWYA